MTQTIRLAGRDIAYRVVRSPRRRTIALQIDHDGLQVRTPQRASERQIRGVLEDKAGWVVTKLEDWARRPQRAQRRFESGESFPLFGQTVSLEITAHATRARTRVELKDGQVEVEIDRHLAGEMRTTTIRKGLERWYRREAEADFPERVQRYANRLDRQVAKVVVRDQKRRWGSCDAKGIIRLNWRLIGADPELIDYVCAHEVAHLAVPDHSPRFWAVVGDLMPDWKVRRRRLNDSAGDFVPF
ncbi:M48 family metallopeptidase [Hyphobacterium sp.]|uniref:M48 family metallopeptidase n=1 Tax=Hyphobacterium sp. TaxID=2004662 RepID=UPI003B5280C7